MLDRLLGLAAAAGLVAGTAAAPAGPGSSVVLSFSDPAIVESSGLALQGGLFLTVNDSGDTGRVFAVDRAGRTVGVTSWGDATDVEAVAAAGDGEVWVGDIGDNTGSRSTVQVLRVPVGRGDRTVTPTAYDLVYPGGPRDAETLLADPASGRLYVVSKEVFGAGLYVAPRELSADHPNRLRRVPDVDVLGFATDGAFFPDGQHYVVRGYGSAAVYTYPGHELVARFDLPAQPQGEGVAVGPDDTLYLSSEGLHSKVLAMPLPARVQRALAPPTPSTPSTPCVSVVRGCRSRAGVLLLDVHRRHPLVAAAGRGRSGRVCGAGGVATSSPWLVCVGPLPTSPGGPGAGRGADSSTSTSTAPDCRRRTPSGSASW